MGGENTLRTQLMRRKSDRGPVADAGPHRGGLKRALGALDLTVLGIGAIIGAGIFVMTGVGARMPGRGWSFHSCWRAWPARWRRCAMPSLPR